MKVAATTTSSATKPARGPSKADRRVLAPPPPRVTAASCDQSSARLPPAIPTEVFMRLIGLAAILAVSIILSPVAAEAQQGAKIARIGYLLRDNDNPTASSNPRDAFSKDCVTSVTWRAATS
jgi:hypothetical protein